MFTIVGLGNPGAKYDGTRHNVGFVVVETLVAELGGAWENKFDCRYCRVRMDGSELLFAEPLRFMNRSGEALQPLLHFFKSKTETLIVVHDEIDLECGALVVKRGGAAAGHKGVADIIRVLGTNDFIRLRVGVGHPRDTVAAAGENEHHTVPPEVSSWVLGRPGPAERELLKSSVLEAISALKTLVIDGLEITQQRHNRRRNK